MANNSNSSSAQSCTTKIAKACAKGAVTGAITGGLTGGPEEKNMDSKDLAQALAMTVATTGVGAVIALPGGAVLAISTPVLMAAVAGATIVGVVAVWRKN